MKKINAIFSEKMSQALLPIKTKKVMSAIDAAVLNAEDDLQTLKLKYEETLAELSSSSSIGGTISAAVAYRKKVADVEANLAHLEAVKADLESEVEVPAAEK